jgi:long-chain acyl-CoA synthetase
MLSYFSLLNGASIGYYSGDVLKLKEDMADLKPTVFGSVPRLYNRFYDVIKG